MLFKSWEGQIAETRFHLHYLSTALQTCRDGGLPLFYVPPSVVKLRLGELEKNILSDLQLVIPVDDI
jgi:hypothetical protein